MASNNNPVKLLLGCTGSVATIKVPVLAEILVSNGYSVIIVPTTNAIHFLKSHAVANNKVNDFQEYCKKNCESCSWHHIGPKDNLQKCDFNSVNKESLLNPCMDCEIKALYPQFKIVTDKDEWSAWQNKGDPVKHIELREWADILLLAPLDANSLAKISNGQCDNLLTCIVRAWNFSKPLLFCPAMNTQMYNHPFTSVQINKLKTLGFNEVGVTKKTLVCGEYGLGAMAEVDVIVEEVKNILSRSNIV